MNRIIRFIHSLFFYSLAGLGISLTIRADIGVSSFNSVNVAISNAIHMKVGSITILINLLFLLGYMVLTQFSKPLKYTLQVISVLCLGLIINIFTHYSFLNMLISNYILKLLVFILGTIIAGFSTGMVINFDTITFPIESFCLALADKMSYSFVKLRYLVDIFSIITSLGVSYLFNLSFFVREGTIISLILLSAVINLTKKIYYNFFIKNASNS